MKNKQNILDAVEKLKTQAGIMRVQISPEIQTLIDAIDDYSKLSDLVKNLGEFTVVTGDCVQRTNPHATQMCNTTVSWAVSDAFRPAHSLRSTIKEIEKYTHND
jgi:hypothetical protein